MWLRIETNSVQPEQEEEDSSSAWRSEVLLVLFAGENVEWKINGRCLTLCYGRFIFSILFSLSSVDW